MPGPLETLQEYGLEGINRWYSSYRAIVLDNQDPDDRNRLKVSIPQFSNQSTMWAFPKGQHGSENSGFKLLPPLKGDIVWVEFEFGDPLKPVWTYHGWGRGQVPEELKGNKAGIVTPSGLIIVIDDDEGTLNINFTDVENEDKYTKLSINRGNLSIDTSVDITIKSKATIILNEGEEGIPISSSLVDRLNILEGRVNDIATLLETKPVVQGSPVTTPGTFLPLVDTTLGDIASEKILQ